MALQFISAWLSSQHSNPDLMDPVINVDPDAVPQNCNVEEEEDDICWFLGKIILYYCLVVTVIHFIYLGLDRIQRKKCCNISCKILKNEKGCQVCGCECHVKFTFCGFLRRLFGGKMCICREVPAICPSIKKALKECISKLSQQTFCDSDSSDSGTFLSHSRASSWKGSRTQTEDSGSASNQRSKKGKKKAKSPEEGWVRAQPCSRCKAKRTREWLAQHFFDQD